MQSKAPLKCNLEVVRLMVDQPHYRLLSMPSELGSKNYTIPVYSNTNET